MLEQMVVLDSFQYDFGDAADKVKLFPMLTQIDAMTGKASRRYLLPGQSTSGVSYFEMGDSWGSYYPKKITSKKGKIVTKVKIIIEDSLGKKHKSMHEIPVVELNEARKFNEEFGNTLEKTHYRTITD